MEIQVQQLLETIKKDGIEAADKQSAEIITKAREEAERIVNEARKQAEESRTQAEENVKRLEASARAAIAQAGRDLTLAVQAKLKEIFDGIVLSTVKEQYSAETLEKAIVATVSALADTSKADLVLSPDQEKKLAASLKAKIADALKKGLEIKPSARIDGGFLIQEKDGKAYYDFSTQTVAQAISVYLNPFLAEIVKS